VPSHPPGSALRLDFAPISRVQLTSTGALRIDAALGRVGVCVYRPKGAPERRELRPPDEVFRADSMATLAGAIVTDLHPPREEAWMTPQSWRKHAVGWVGDTVHQDGALLRGTVTVQDAEMIALVREGKRREVSPGYACRRIDPTPGRWDGKDYGPHVTKGEPYDFVQRDIVYNSVGIGPRGWGRQGSEVALRLDSVTDDGAILRFDGTALGDFIRTTMLAKGLTLIELAKATGIYVPQDEDKPLLRQGPAWAGTWVLESILDGYTDRPSDEQLRAIAAALDVDLDTLIRLIPTELQKLDSRTTESPRMDEIEIHLDGLTVKVPKSAAQLVQKAIADRDAKITALTADASTMQARFDGLTEKLTKAEADAAAAPAAARAAAEARIALEGKARSVLGADFRLDGKSDRELREAVIAKLKPKAELTGKDDAYINARFDSAFEEYTPDNASQRVTRALFPATPPAAPQMRQDAGDNADPYDPAAARARMLQSSREAWRQKPAS
jgi:hypothetical protein